MAPFPHTADSVSADWLTDALQRFGSADAITSVDVISKNNGTNDNARLRLHRAANGDQGPATLFAKGPPAHAERRQQVIGTGMGRREVLFYQSLAAEVDLELLEVHAAEYDEVSGAFFLALEDLTDVAKAFPDFVAGLPATTAATALEGLARMHVRFEDDQQRETVAPWLTTRPGSSTYGRRMLKYALDNHRDRLTGSFARVSETYIDHQELLQQHWSAGRPTIIHGDPHIGNIFLRNAHAGFLDWGLVAVGSAMRDTSYFIAMCLDPAERRRTEDDLLAHYVDCRTQLGNNAITLDDARSAHRLHAAYTAVASCQIVTFPTGVSAARAAFAAAFLRRSEAIIQDLDVVDLLEGLLR